MSQNTFGLSWEMYLTQNRKSFKSYLYSRFQDTSVFKKHWSIVDDIDHEVIKSSEYLMEAAHSFRLYLKQHMQGARVTKNNPKPTPVEKPNLVTLWVAKTFPQWQSCILSTLKTIYDV